MPHMSAEIHILTDFLSLAAERIVDGLAFHEEEAARFQNSMNFSKNTIGGSVIEVVKR